MKRSATLPFARLMFGPFLFGLLVGSPASAIAQSAVTLAHFPRPPAMDGSLGDPEWQHATRFSGFKTLHPRAGGEPSESTVVYLAYDRYKLYIAARCDDRGADSLRAVASDADDAFHDDWTAFCLDPHDQGLDAYYFLLTPAGFRVTGILGAQGGPVQSSNLAWAGAAKRTEHGYSVEMAIPLAQMPYRSGDSVRMAFKVARAIARRGEEVDFPAIDPRRAQVVQFQAIQLTDIAGSTAPYDRPLFDARAAYRDKLKKLAQYGDSTMDARVEAWGDASVFDEWVFPSRPLRPSDTPAHFARRLDAGGVASRFASLEYAPQRRIGNLESFLTRTQTTSFVVIRDDTILYDRYFNGWGSDSVFTSFSVAKAFVSTLVGIAIDRGVIASVGDTITRYLPELARRDVRFSRITIRDLLRMASGLRYVEDEDPYDNRWTYLAPDLRRSALERSTIVEEPGKRWLYNNYNPLLLGMILERASGRSVTDLLQEWIWNPLGMEHGGSWSLDSRGHGFEKMESGINARPVDFAKLGAAYLHGGRWNGRQVVPADWVHDATQPWPEPPGYYEDQGFFGPGGHYFGYFWWGDTRSGGDSDFHTIGNKGQLVWCSSQKHLIIVRTGMEYGIGSGAWLRLFRQFADQF